MEFSVCAVPGLTVDALARFTSVVYAGHNSYTGQKNCKWDFLINLM